MARRYLHRIEFRKPTEATADSGQVTRTFADNGDNFTRWAHVAPMGGSKPRIDGQLSVAADFQIELPHDAAIDDVDNATWQIKWLDTSKTMNVVSLTTDYNGRSPITTIAGTLNR